MILLIGRALARCALDRGEPLAAVRHASAAVQLAEPLGDDVLTGALEVLVAAYRTAGDLDAAWDAATRKLQVARRLGSHYRLYHALIAAVDVALDRTDLDTARSLLDELDRHATALDTDTTGTTLTGEVARRRQRLTDLQPTT